MCGIAGILHLDGRSPSADDVRPMVSCLLHRGPDTNGQWNDGPIALGHTRLSIIDLSPASNQPFISDDGDRVLVYNGEVYNYRELRDELIGRGHAFRTTGDTE